MGKVVGIDLGTTNSVAAFKFAEVEVVTNDDNSPPERKLTRSVVADKKGQFLVGEKAYNQLKADPTNVILSVKRLMGRSFSNPDIQDKLSKFAYKITQSSQGTENSIAVWLGGKEYQPEEISAEILKKVVTHAQIYQNNRGQKSTITQAVITIPAYFDDKQRKATQIAATKAELSLLQLLPEPTAAAISYGFKPDADDVKIILVYDFGGGTFDSSLITAAGNQFIESVKAGDLWLGGDDIDQQIIEYVKQRVAAEEDLDNIDGLITKMPFYQRVRFLADLKMAAEKAKIELSSVTSVQIIPPTPLIDDLGAAIYIDVELTRTKLEEIILPLVERSITICQDAIKYSDYPADMIDVVLLVGGSSQIPLVQQKVREAFGNEKVVVHPRPMYAVAEGAAIVAAGLTETVATLSRDYYIKLEDGSRYKLMARGEILPIHSLHTFKTIADGQRLIHLEFLSPDNVKEEIEQTNKEDLIGEMWLGLDEYYPQGTEIVVSLEIDERMGYLQVTAALKNDPSVKVSCSLSRGGVDEKIYKEIEQTIEEIKARDLTAYGVEEVLKKIVPIVKITNRIVNNTTGGVREDYKNRAQKELQEFKATMSEERVLLESLLKRHEFLLETCDFLIPDAQQERMRNLVQKMKLAIASHNVSAMQALAEEATQELRNLPDLAHLILLSLLAIIHADAVAPTQANAMTDKLYRMIGAMKRGNANEVDLLWRELQPDVSKWIDQEVPSRSIATGLSR
ncbi:MAG TPA: Hsp70 family protein [Nostocaceae cyanobacterium]|nr:Hsp70 family protein [Nostocaceae cyanobacterium]